MLRSKILKVLWRLAVLQFFLSIWNKRRECKEDTMKSIGGRLGSRESKARRSL